MHSRLVKTIILFWILSLAMMTLSGCIMAPVVPPMGAAFSDYEAPLDLSANGGKTIGLKRGESHSRCILGMVTWGDAGVRAAMEEGGIHRVDHLDYGFRNYFFGIYMRYTTIAYGE